MTFSEYAENWFRTYKCNKAINTKAMYQNIINTHLIPNIGHLRLSDIRKSDIQNIINQNYSKPETCRKIIMVLKQIMESATEDRLIVLNPVNRIELPAKPESKKRALTELEKKAIMNAELSQMERAYINVLFYFGLRREEALITM